MTDVFSTIFMLYKNNIYFSRAIFLLISRRINLIAREFQRKRFACAGSIEEAQ